MSFSTNDLPHAQIRLREVEVSRMVEFSATCSLINNDRLHLEFSRETLLPFACQDIFVHYRIGQSVSWHSKVRAVMHLTRRPGDIQDQQPLSIKPSRGYALVLWAPTFAWLLETRLTGARAHTHSGSWVSLQERAVHNSDREGYFKYLKRTQCNLAIRNKSAGPQPKKYYPIYPLLPNICD